MQDQEKRKRLTALVARLKAGADPTQLRLEAQSFLALIAPTDLTEVEQALIDAGLQPEDLRHLCSHHLAMLGDEATKLKSSLSPGHMIHTLISEHEHILHFLDELEKLNQRVQSADGEKIVSAEQSFLQHLAEHLLGAEPHHQREEKILFPVAEEAGLVGPPQIMRAEHEDLRRYKHELEALAANGPSEDFGEWQRNLDRVVKFLVLTLRDHIFKENNILYPSALELIGDEAQWTEMKAAADKIGYCCFTPEN